MRVFVQGGEDGARCLIEGALLAAGCILSDATEASDLGLSIDGGAPDMLVRHGLRLDLAASIAERSGRAIRLSRIEVGLLAALMRSDRPLGRHDLLLRVWGYGFDPGTNIVAVHVARLRAKLGAGAIVLEGGGYRIGAEERPTS